MSVAVVIPYRRTSAQRDANARWLWQRWTESPGAVSGRWSLHRETDNDSKIWSKAWVLNRAVAILTADVLIIADADIVTPWSALEEAVALVEAGVPWVVPHGQVYRLKAGPTAKLIKQTSLPGYRSPALLPLGALDRPAYTGTPGGGLLVVARAAWDAVGGMDPRFLWWSGEDVALGHALDTLAGRHQRLDAPLFHLYHPPERRRPFATSAAHRLEARYARAAGNVSAMRALIAESPRPNDSRVIH